MFNKFKKKLSKNTEIIALGLLLFTTILSTTYYNFNKKKIFENYKNILNNVYFKKTMRKTSIKSSLDELSGVGSARKKLLLRYFGSLEQIKRASIDDLCEVSGIGKTTAESIYREMHTQ